MTTAATASRIRSVQTSGAELRQKPKRVPLAGCIFCGAKPLTEEHVLPQWLRTFAGLDYPDSRIERKRDDEVTHENLAPAFTQRFRVVCKSCNTGWMHQLEDAVMADLSLMVHGTPATLTTQTARYIATWLVKTMCVFEYADLVTGENIPGAHYDQLFERKTRPPDWCQVWLASANVPRIGQEIHLVEKNCERINLTGNSVLGEAQDWWFGTLRIGAVLLQVLGSRGEHPVLMDRQQFLGTRAAQIWPRQPRQLLVNFPPGRPVSFEEMRPIHIEQMRAELVQTEG